MLNNMTLPKLEKRGLRQNNYIWKHRSNTRMKKGLVGRNNGELWRHLWYGRKYSVVGLYLLINLKGWDFRDELTELKPSFSLY